MATPGSTFAARLPARVRVGLTPARRGDVLQLARFLGVGAVGYTVNLGVFALVAHGLGVNFRLAVVASFSVALLTTFTLNRHFTFEAAHGPVLRQLRRYAVVNVGGFVTNFAVLVLLVSVAGVLKLPAEAIAAAVATPVNFLGGRLWAFRHHHR